MPFLAVNHSAPFPRSVRHPGSGQLAIAPTRPPAHPPTRPHTHTKTVLALGPIAHSQGGVLRGVGAYCSSPVWSASAPAAAPRAWYICVYMCGKHAMPQPVRHYTRHHDARSAPRRLEPGGMAPTRRETGASRAQTALTDTPAIYTTAPPPVSPWAAALVHLALSSAAASSAAALSSAAAACTAVTASTDTDIPAAALSCRRQAILASSRSGRRRKSLVHLAGWLASISLGRDLASARPPESEVGLSECARRDERSAHAREVGTCIAHEGCAHGGWRAG